MKQEAAEKQKATLPKKGEKGFQGNARESIPAHKTPESQRTSTQRAKAAGTNRKYLEASALADDDLFKK